MMDVKVMEKAKNVIGRGQNCENTILSPFPVKLRFHILTCSMPHFQI